MKRLLTDVLLVCLSTASIAHTQNAPSNQEARTLTLGQTVSDSLTSGEVHTYTVDLEADQFVYGEADQQTVDVVVRVYTPDGTNLDTYDIRARGSESFQFSSITPGTHRIEVAPFQEEQGRYAIGIESIEPLATAPEARVSSIADMRDSGGPPIPEQQKYDVNFYDLNLQVDPDQKWIGGHLTMTATTVEELDVVVLHLDSLLQVGHVEVGTQQLRKASWKRKGGLILVDPGSPIPQAAQFSVRVDYAGHPLRVENPDEVSFGDGFYFEQTPAGQPWVSLISVFTGADVWMPVKDHPSDEPDSMAIAITAPEALEVASNGRLQEITDNEDGTRTHHWFVSNPINTWSATARSTSPRTGRSELSTRV